MIRKLKLILLLFYLTLYTTEIFAQSPEQLMMMGNKFYQEQKYEEAIESYQKLLSQGYESAALYYNLGNAYFRLGKLGYAILNYEKGLKLSPGDEDLLYNIKIANARTSDKITELPKLFIVQWWEILITSFSINSLTVITILVYLIFLTSIGFYFLSNSFDKSKKVNIQRTAFIVGSTSFIVLIIAAIILIARYNHEAATNYGILLEPAYSAKVAPDSKSNDAFVIHEGIKFIVEDHVNDWVKIRLVDGKVGWIHKDVYGEI